MDICIDFDGTCVTHEMPKVGDEKTASVTIGKDVGAVPVLQEIVKNGHRLILYTMRGGKYLRPAVKWFYENKIKLFGINYNPMQTTWTDSTKPYAQLYIDDLALGCPLKNDKTLSENPFVDWIKVREILINKGII